LLASVVAARDQEEQAALSVTVEQQASPRMLRAAPERALALALAPAERQQRAATRHL